MTLASTSISREGAVPSAAILFLHGILGRGLNLRTIARRFVDQRPAYRAVLVDLRAHGDSVDQPGPDTLEQAARDLDELELDVPVRAVVGHSFGGKVALAWLAQPPARAALEHVFVLDSMIGARPTASAGDDTMAVIDRLEGASERTFPSREAFIAELERLGSSRTLAQWLGTSLERTGGGFRFALSLPRIRALIASYASRDLWGLIEDPPAHVHLVIAAHGDAFDAEARARAQRAAGPRLSVDVLETGHWVHVHDPEGLLRVLLSHA